MTTNAARVIGEWRRNALRFVHDNFKLEPDAWQKKALELLPSKDPKHSRISLQACAGPGKLQNKSMLLYTPDGLRRWGDLKVGDYVFAEDGSPTKIIKTTDNGIVRMYRVWFNDGSSTLAGAEHLWKVRGRAERRYWKDDKKNRCKRSIKYSENNRKTKTYDPKTGYSILTTEEIIKRNNCSDGSRRQFEIPRQGSVNFNKSKPTKIAPYLIGVWLGDGSRNQPAITGIDLEIDERIKSLGYEISRTRYKNLRIKGVVDEFRRLDVFSKYSHERYIPEEYKLSSVEERIELLRGLMDTDGCVDRQDSHCEYDTTSKALALDVIWLVRSLGGKAILKKSDAKKSYKDKNGNKIICRNCYRVTVTTPFNPFHLSRKNKRWRKPCDRYLTRYIDKIEPDVFEDSMCIEVEHESKCYLANDFIVTHNSALLAWSAWWFLSCCASRGEHPKGAAVAVTRDNLRDNIWPELSKWQSRSEFLKGAFEWGKERVFAKDHPETWFISARSWSKTADADEQGRTLSGLHSKYVLYLVDESGDIPTSVLRAAEQGLSNCTWGKIIQAGNPTSLDGMLHFAANDQRDKWSIIRITGDPDDPDRSPRIDKQWAKEQIEQYGRDNPWVKSYILGEFPPSSINTLLGIEDVEKAIRRQLRESDYIFSQKRLGIDVAREGDDRSVLFPRQGLYAFKPVIMRNSKGYEIAARAAVAKQNWGQEIEMVDDTGGWGGAVIEAMQMASMSPMPVNFASRAPDPRYHNLRSYMWFKMAEWVKNGGRLPNSPELIKELTCPTYTFVNGKFLLEEKAQIKKRLKISPDLADALAVTFAIPDIAASDISNYEYRKAVGSTGKLASDYDPYSEDRF